jgi:hypothetical protein
MVLHIGMVCFHYLPSNNLLEVTEITTMVSWGTGNSTENCFLTTYHPSFYWVLAHWGPYLGGALFTVGSAFSLFLLCFFFLVVVLLACKSVQSSTRGLNQIWLQVKEESRKV